MAHPFAQHKEHKKSHSRANYIMKSGGVPRHSDEAADKKLFHKLIAEHEKKEMKVEGKLSHKRFARGGKVLGGDASEQNLKAWAARASDNSYARGGRLPDAGAFSGVGRLQKAHMK